MRNRLDIYVEGERLDLFKDESISLKASLKDSMSPDKIFTSVSASYVVPASKTNNKIFKHYYRTDVGNTVDARLFLDCELRLGDAVYRQGNISLEKVITKNGEAYSYSIRFYGNLTELTKRIGEDTLTSSRLDYTSDDIDNPDFAVEMRRTISTNPAIAFPIISKKSRFVFHSTDSGHAQTIGENYTNIAYSTGVKRDQYGINTGDLVGAYRCGRIMDAMESAYGITIEGALRAPYITNYRILLTGFESEGSVLEPFTGYSNLSFNNSVSGANVATISSSGITFAEQSATQALFNKIWINFRVKTTTVSDYVVHLLRDGSKIASLNQDTTSDIDTFISYRLTDDDGPYQYTFELETEGSGSVTIEYYIKHRHLTERLIYNDYSHSTTSPPTLSASVSGGVSGTKYRVKDNMPKMKVKDFLTTLFKQFNIVTIVDGLNIKTFHYDYFMSMGDTVDITKFVDSSSSTISPPNYYSGISFKNESPETYMEDAFLSVNQREYGSLEYRLSDEGVQVVGSSYDVKTPTQRIPVERLKDLDDQEDSRVVTLQLTDLNGGYVNTKPVFVYATTNYDHYGTNKLAINTSSTSVQGLTRHSIVTNLYYQYQALGSSTAVVGNYWGVEVDEFHQDSRFDGLGYFNCFWKNYITQAFDYSTRLVQLKANLPSNILLNMQMNTKLIIGSEKFLIESMSTNLTTGITSFKLTSISSSLLANIEASTITIEREDPSTSFVRVVYLSSVTGRLEMSDSLTINCIGFAKEITEY